MDRWGRNVIQQHETGWFVLKCGAAAAAAEGAAVEMFCLTRILTTLFLSVTEAFQSGFLLL